MIRRLTKGTIKKSRKGKNQSGWGHIRKNRILDNQGGDNLISPHIFCFSGLRFGRECDLHDEPFAGCSSSRVGATQELLVVLALDSVPSLLLGGELEHGPASGFHRQGALHRLPRTLHEARTDRLCPGSRPDSSASSFPMSFRRGCHDRTR